MAFQIDDDGRPLVPRGRNIRAPHAHGAMIVTLTPVEDDATPGSRYRASIG
jgi:hypothetical protein